MTTKTKQQFIIESSLLFPILRGKDISAFDYQQSKQIIFAYNLDDLSSPIKNLPKYAKIYFQKNTKSILSLKTCPWQLKGLYPELNAPKIVWPDISKSLQAAYVENPKIWALNSLYYISVSDQTLAFVLTAFLNSDYARNYSSELASTIHSNYKRFIASVINTLPWPFHNKDDEELIAIAQKRNQDPQNKHIKDEFEKQIQKRLKNNYHYYDLISFKNPMLTAFPSYNKLFPLNSFYTLKNIQPNHDTQALDNFSQALSFSNNSSQQLPYIVESNEQLWEKISTITQPENLEKIKKYLISLSEDQFKTLQCAYTILKRHRALLLAEDLGTGKTYIAIALAQIMRLKNVKEIIIVAPASLLPMWKNIAQRANLKIKQFYTYQYASLHQLPFHNNTFWICDEAHFLKNNKTKRYQSIAFAAQSQDLCLISSTPISTSFHDLYNILLLCHYPSTQRLKDKQSITFYAQAITTQSNTEKLTLNSSSYLINDNVHKYHIITKSTEQETKFLQKLLSFTCPLFSKNNFDEFSHLIPQLLIQRLISHPVALLKTLKKLLNYYTKCTQKNHRLLSRKEFFSFFELEKAQYSLPFNKGSTIQISKYSKKILNKTINTLNQLIHELSEILKVDHKLECILHLIINNLPQKTIIFTQYADTARYLALKCRQNKLNTALILANTANYNNHKVNTNIIISAFNPLKTYSKTHNFINPDILISTDKIATGHNLQLASNLIHCDIPFNPTTLLQREARIIRKGQKAKILNLHKLLPLSTYQPLNNILASWKQIHNKRVKIANEWIIPQNIEQINCFYIFPEKKIIYAHCNNIIPISLNTLKKRLNINGSWLLTLFTPPKLKMSERKQTLLISFRQWIESQKDLPMMPIWMDIYQNIKILFENAFPIPNFLTHIHSWNFENLQNLITNHHFLHQQKSLVIQCKAIESHSLSTTYPQLSTKPIYTDNFKSIFYKGERN